MSRISDLAGFTTALSTTEDLSVGIITASSFSGNLTGDVTGTATNASGLTGTPNITVGSVTAASGAFSGNVTIGGTLTYQDVSHIDAVGIITAQQGIQVLANGLDITGVGTFKSDVSIADKIIHTGDANTAIRFPAADTFTVETAGSERLRVSSNVGVGDDNPSVKLNVKGSGDSLAGLNVHSKIEDTTSLAADVGGMLAFEGVYNSGGSEAVYAAIHGGKQNATNGNYQGYLRFFTRPDGGLPLERLRIDSSGNVAIGTATAGGTLHVENSGELNAFFEGSASTLGARIILKNNNNTANAYNDIEGADAGGQGTSAIRFINVNDGNNEGALAIRTRASGGSMAERLRITSGGGVHFNNGELLERINITAGKLSDNTNIDLENGMAHLFTTTETTTATPNIRVNSSTTLNSVMATGDAISVTIITTAAAAGYSAQLTIDGSAVTEKWNGGSAPSAGGSSGNDYYTYNIIKTGDATYTVLANVANFA